MKIHPAFTGICGSDVHLYYDGAVNGGGNSPDHPHPLTGETLPVVFGHEISGTIEAIADDVHTDMKVGDSVVVEAEIACGECPACKAGNYNDCDKLAGIGINGGGGLSEHKEKALQSHSADIVVDPSKEDLAERVRHETDEAGADLVFDAAGAEPVDHQLLEALKATGGLMVVALHGKPITLNLTKELGFGEKFIRCTMGYANDHADAIKLIHDRNIDLSTFITDRIKVEDIVDKGFRQLRQDAENHVKIIVSM
ncbi:alcohol dehydrogenase catalytic domain-containing protein [Bifidobacterium asteroides]|uniref:alcohol dehydrogenase catalytic domain-containing protein n=1 Tax=Bifidobacterium asteroides TaxID=1684 RepID=UPI001C64C868|nr:alcohol dehydrogenase catalytic domain-containing protein [Bifidobacterium asteroides]